MASPRASGRTTTRSSELPPSARIVRRLYVESILFGKCASSEECVQRVAYRTGIATERVRELLWAVPGRSDRGV